MREIKFRAWWLGDKIMESWSEIFMTEPLSMYFRSDERPVLMQYTGLKDKNGKEIYEGDIVKPVQTKGMRWKLATVEYQRGEFVILPKGETRSFKTLTETGWLKIEVIGNVWENSELLT